MLLLTEVLSRGWLGVCVGQGYPDSPGDSLRKSYPDLYTGDVIHMSGHNGWGMGG